MKSGREAILGARIREQGRREADIIDQFIIDYHICNTDNL